MSNRIEKVNSLLEQEISKIIQREADFSLLAGQAGDRHADGVLVTLTAVEATANLIEAKVYISVFPQEKSKEVFKILEKEVWSIQQKINKKLKMRPVPKIIFVIDKKEEKFGRVEELLAELKKQKK